MTSNLNNSTIDDKSLSLPIGTQEVRNFFDDPEQGFSVALPQMIFNTKLTRKEFEKPWQTDITLKGRDVLIKIPFLKITFLWKKKTPKFKKNTIPP